MPIISYLNDRCQRKARARQFIRKDSNKQKPETRQRSSHLGEEKDLILRPLKRIRITKIVESMISISILRHSNFEVFNRSRTDRSDTPKKKHD